MKKPFHKTTWSEVVVGDLILVPGDEEPIAQATIKEIHPLTTDEGANLINVCYRFGYATYGVRRHADGTVYVQSRL